jgi:Alpha/beta hydrolase of unknown function (DUF900)
LAWTAFVAGLKYPTLQDVWDLNASTQAVGSVSVQEPFSWQQILFGADGTMDWFKPSERGLDAGPGINSVTELRYYALLSTAAQFNNINDWRWLGPLSWGYSTAVALLVNDAGMVAGYGGVYTGNPTFDALRPTHAFRAPASGEFDGTAIILTNDLGVLPGGLHSFPRAMNRAGELVGYSDFDVMNTGGLNFSQYNSHAVFWGLTNEAPECLTNYPASYKAPHGYGDAFAINDQDQIVGASMQALGYPVGVLWQLNHNTNDTPFWEITDLNDRLTDPSWQVFRAVGINNDGVILAHAANAAGEKHAVLLIPMAMAVDNNRDGQITFDSADQTTTDTPYRFWINDSQEHDDDESAVGADDQIPGIAYTNILQPNYPNYRHIRMQGRSDLVNFFPVALQLGNILRLLPPTNGYEYHLYQADRAIIGGAVKFIYTSLTLTNAFDYLTNTASFGYGTNFDEAALEADTIPVNHDVVLDTNFLAHVQNNGGTGIILVEGCATTSHPLMLEIWFNGKLLGGIPLYLSLSGVEQMFRHLNFSYVNSSVKVPARTDAPNEPQTKKDANFVFLHGYNVNQQQARGVLSEMFKRFYWSGSRARFYGVTWNGAESQIASISFTPNYHTNVVNALQTAPHLAGFLNGLSGETTVAAHSLGNMVVLSAISDCGVTHIAHYFMIDAAVPIEAVQGNAVPDPYMIYPDWIQYANRLYASDWWKLFPVDDYRSTLTWSNRVGNLQNVDIYNFYSSGEEVLRENRNGAPPFEVGITVNNVGYWIQDIYTDNHLPVGTYGFQWQEMLKGRGGSDIWVGSTHGGWRFPANEYGDPNPLPPATANNLPDSTLQQTPVFDFGSSFDQISGPFPDLALLGPDGSAYALAHRDRILSDAIPALTLPVGANPIPAFNTIHRNFDLTSGNFQNGWPASRLANEREYNKWHHSDFDYVAYPFTHKLFEKIVNDGNLR